MNCPVCGENTKVVDSRPDTDNVMRMRKCLVCGYKFKTLEVDDDLFEKLKKQAGLYVEKL